MKSTWQFLKLGLCLAALFWFSSHASAYQDFRDSFDNKSQQVITKGILDQQIRIIPQLNKLNFGLGKHDGINFYYKKTLSKIFFQDHTIATKVTKIEFDDMKISMELFHSVLGAGRIQFVFDEDLLSRASDEDLQKILLTTIADENNKYVFGDPDSKLFHLYSCLHTPNESKLVRLTKDEARSNGYRPCAFCFKNELYLPDLAIEMEIEREWSERLRDYEPLMDGSARQLYLRNLGQRVLRNWPFQLMGYDYSFQLIKSSRMNAIAIPTGKIVVSTALMEALENESEVEALLVLAIAHVERRHSLKQYRFNVATAEKADTMRSIVKAAGSVAGLFPGGSLIGTIGSLNLMNSSSSQSSVLGFDDDFKKEADAIAGLYFNLNYENHNSLSSLVRKMQIAQLAAQLHPELGNDRKEFYYNERIKRVENTKFLYFDGSKSFVLKRKNRVPVQLDLLYQSVIGKESRLIVYISDKSLLPAFNEGDGEEKVSLLIKAESSKQRFKLQKKLSTKDLWGTQLTFEARGKKGQQFIQEIENIQLIVTSPVGHADKRGEQRAEYYTFFEGKLEY